MSRQVSAGSRLTQYAHTATVGTYTCRSYYVWVESIVPQAFLQQVDDGATGPATTPVDADSDGLATVIGVGITVVTNAVTSSGLAAVNGVSGVVAASNFGSSGVATVNIVGGVAATTVPVDGTSNGVAFVDGKGGSAQGGVFNTNGVAVVNANTGVTARSVYGSAGVASVFGNGVDSAAVSTAGFPYTVTLRRRRRGHVNA